MYVIERDESKFVFFRAISIFASFLHREKMPRPRKYSHNGHEQKIEKRRRDFNRR
jgi:hypothetical protein